MKPLILSWVFLLSFSFANAQPPQIEWAKCYGGTDEDIAYHVEIVQNGYLVVGTVFSTDGDITGNHGGIDGSLMYIDSVGNLLWERTCGGSFIDNAYSAIRTFDGGYIVFGDSQSSDGDGGAFHGFGQYDAWVVKLDSNRNRIWKKGYGGTDIEQAIRCNIEQTNDSGFIFTAAVNSSNGDVVGHHACNGCGYDYWVVKINSMGILQWQKCLGGTDNDYPYKVHQTFDKGFIVCGYSVSFDGDLTGSHGGFEAFVVKMDSTGQVEWMKVLGGSGSDGFSQIRQTPDSGYICIGSTSSNDGDVFGNNGGEDIWIVKLDKSGGLIWQKCIGTSVSEFASDFDITSDDGFVIAYQGGNTTDFSILKTDSIATMAWQKFIGGSEFELAESIKQTSDGGYIVTGSTTSNDGDVIGRHGNAICHGGGIHCEDYWVVKLSASGTNVLDPLIESVNLNVFYNEEGFMLVKFLSKKNGRASISLTDVLGRSMIQQEVEVQQGFNNIRLLVKQIIGIYIVNLNGEIGVGTKKVAVF